MSRFSTIPEILDDLRAGRMVVLVDDEQRENEGDLVMAAEKVTPEAVNFMTKFGRGIVCLALDEARCRALDLVQMSRDNTSKFGTAFTVTIDAATGVTSGTSAQDRARTVLTAIDEACAPGDLVRPGHIFPIQARDGGVLVRAGHTEGSVDLARLAGLKTAAVICEILDEDGAMARLPRLLEISSEHGLKMATIADLIAYRRAHERLIEKVVETALPTRFGQFRLHCYKSKIDSYLHLALAAGDVGHNVQAQPVLVRVHSECLTGDIFHSLRCDCGEQMEGALAAIIQEGRGVFLYIRQEGRGIGLVDKLKSYALQEQGLDTVEANAKLGLPADLREYGIGAQILYDLGVRKMRLLSNNPRKIVSIKGFGLEVVERVPIEIVPNRHNVDYLRAKRDKLGHMLGDIEST